MPLRLIATDLDGTLLRSDGQVSAFTRRTLGRLQAAGIPVIPATARPIGTAIPVAEELGLGHPVICLNGAVVYDPTLGTIRDAVALDHEQVSSLVAMVSGRCPEVAFAFDTAFARFADPRWSTERIILPASPRTHRLDAGALPESPIICLLALCQAHDTRCLLPGMLHAAPGWCSAFSSIQGLLEVTLASVSKAAALDRVCASLGIPSREVIAFGDMPIDLPMLAWAGVGVAVGNAHPEVLRLAEHVAPSNDQDGVAVLAGGLLEARRLIGTT